MKHINVISMNCASRDLTAFEKAAFSAQIAFSDRTSTPAM
jgi:hypothetical protein